VQLPFTIRIDTSIQRITSIHPTLKKVQCTLLMCNTLLEEQCALGAQRQEAPELPRTIRVGPNEGGNNVASQSMRKFVLCMIKVFVFRMVEAVYAPIILYYHTILDKYTPRTP